MGTAPIYLQAIFVLASENCWKIANLNSTIENTSIHWSKEKIARFSLEKIANVNRPLLRNSLRVILVLFVCAHTAT